MANEKKEQADAPRQRTALLLVAIAVIGVLMMLAGELLLDSVILSRLGSYVALAGGAVYFLLRRRGRSRKGEEPG